MNLLGTASSLYLPYLTNFIAKRDKLQTHLWSGSNFSQLSFWNNMSIKGNKLISINGIFMKKLFFLLNTYFFCNKWSPFGIFTLGAQNDISEQG